MSAADFRVDRMMFPSLFLDESEWENLPEKLEDPFFEHLHEVNLRSLERMDPLDPPRERSRTLKNRVARTTVAWYLTRDERWLEMAKEALAAACRLHDLWWVTDEHVGGIRAGNLSTGEMLYTVALGYDALHPYLTDDEKRMCVDALINEGLAAYLKGIELKDWWVKCDFNWNSALHGNAGLAAMAIRNEDEELSDRVLEEAVTGLPYMIDAFYPDGGYIEGIMYLGTAIGHLTDFIAPYYKFTGDDLGLLSNQAFEDTLTFRMYMWGEDGKPYNFSDISEFMRGGGLPHIFYWGRMLDRPDLTGDQDRRLARSRGGGGLFYDIESFWYREAFPEAEDPTFKRLRHFKGIDWLTWRGDRSWLAFRSGFNGGNHDNDDLGHFILGFDEERFLCDPGYGPRDASQHNCITVRGFEQTDCATARITELEELEDGFYLKCDIQEAFPHVSEYYERHLLLTGDQHLLLIDDIMGVDDIRTTVRGHLQTRLPFEKTDEGWRIDGEQNALRVLHLSDTGFYDQWDWEHGKEPDNVIHTLCWRDIYDRVHSVQVTLLTFGDPELECTVDDDRIVLMLDGGRHEFLREEGRLHYSGAAD
ncbi:MAG: hypothetical protein R6X33_10050 [Candidatus Brocadiia bacterium]